MIVLDEQLHSRTITARVSSWYRGRVASITALRPGTVIKDDAIPHLLRQVAQPTFVTINVSDFWRITPASSSYCLVAVDVPLSRASQVPDLLRRLFHMPEFASRRSRMGKVVRLGSQRVEYYEGAGTVQTIVFPSS